MKDPPTVYVCVGGDCRKGRPNAHRKLRDGLERAGADVRPVRCQKVCKGPVVGVRVGGDLHWLRRVAGRALRADLLRLLQTGRWPKALKKRRVKKRRGKLRS